MTEEKQINNKNKALRMEPEHQFKFNCYPGVPCFTQCCRDITILLTPYDIMRLKNSLGISSDKFIEKYTLILPQKKNLIPLVALKMNEDDKKCPFVTKKGCVVYNDRPWPCRMYPLDMNDDGTYSLITDSKKCLGLNEDDTWNISDWLSNQGIVPFEKMNERLSAITIPLKARELDIDNPKIQQMIFMSLYNLDKFKEFVFSSSFLDRLDVEPERIDKIKENDEELLLLAFDWIEFGLLGKKAFGVKDQAS